MSNNLTARIFGAQQNAQQPAGNKEETMRAEFVTMHKGELANPISVRCWMGRSASASQVYCCIWIRTARGTWHSGKGAAGGCGYHKASAAMQAALDSAGVQLYGYPYSGPNHDREGNPIENIQALKKERAFIGGVGESAMRSAMEAIARAAGYRGKFIILGV